MEIDFVKQAHDMAAVHLKQARESLVRASQEAMRQENADWTQIDGLLSVVKRLDQLRHDVTAMKRDDNRRDAQVIPKSLGRIDKSGYPKYMARKDGSVVRVGLSQDGSEYEHVAKEYDFRSIIEMINRFVNAEAFTVDDVQKQLNLPSYLTHLVISLLREKLGKLESPKRGRYVFVEKIPLNADSLIEGLQVIGDEA